MVSMKWNGALASIDINAAAAAGANAAAQRLRALSVAKAPIQDGVLRGTARVTPATPSDLTASVSYDTVYAVRQHEELAWHHSDGQAKYLEGPLNESKDELLGIVAKQMRGAFGG